jgi:hypothetical protein
MPSDPALSSCPLIRIADSCPQHPGRVEEHAQADAHGTAGQVTGHEVVAEGGEAVEEGRPS